MQKPSVVLKLQKPKKKKKVQWNAGTVDNEFMGKKSSKCELIMLQNFMHLPMPSLFLSLPPPSLLPSSFPPSLPPSLSLFLSLSLTFHPPCLPSSLSLFLPFCFPSFLSAFLPSLLLLNLPLLSQVVVCTKNLVFSGSRHRKVIQIMMMMMMMVMMMMKATMLTALAIKRNMEIPKSPTKVRKLVCALFFKDHLHTAINRANLWSRCTLRNEE